LGRARLWRRARGCRAAPWPAARPPLPSARAGPAAAQAQCRPRAAPLLTSPSPPPRCGRPRGARPPARPTGRGPRRAPTSPPCLSPALGPRGGNAALRLQCGGCLWCSGTRELCVQRLLLRAAAGQPRAAALAPAVQRGGGQVAAAGRVGRGPAGAPRRRWRGARAARGRGSRRGRLRAADRRQRAPVQIAHLAVEPPRAGCPRAAWPQSVKEGAKYRLFRGRLPAPPPDAPITTHRTPRRRVVRPPCAYHEGARPHCPLQR
jgi:hypothetical protein